MAKSKTRTPKPTKKRVKPAWLTMTPGGRGLPPLSLEQLAKLDDSHPLLSEAFPGPPELGARVRAFRVLMMHALARVADGEARALERAWRELERYFGRDASFRLGYFVPSWLLLDFPSEPGGRTAAELYEDFARSAGREDLAELVAELRATRLGVYQEVSTSPTAVRLRELYTEREIDVAATFEQGAPGELYLGRLVELGRAWHFWGEFSSFPAEARDKMVEMIGDKLSKLSADVAAENRPAAYERLMKLAGPYWMSIVGGDADMPILDPAHYESYLGEDDES